VLIELTWATMSTCAEYNVVWQFICEFQTLLTGIGAVAAGFLAYRAALHQAYTQKKIFEEKNRNNIKAFLYVLEGDLDVLADLIDGKHDIVQQVDEYAYSKDEINRMLRNAKVTLPDTFQHGWREMAFVSFSVMSLMRNIAFEVNEINESIDLAIETNQNPLPLFSSDKSVDLVNFMEPVRTAFDNVRPHLSKLKLELRRAQR
jgi:hypothetical protein